MTPSLQVEIETIPQLLDVEVEQLPQYLDVSIADAAEHLDITVSPDYLGVFPAKIQWVDTYTEAQYNVVSNKEWQIQ